MQNQKPYEKLKFYQDICEIRRSVFLITERFGRDNIRLVSQMRDAARSAKQNIREGYSKGTLAEMLHGIRISQGSLEELTGDLEDCLEDGLMTPREYQAILKLARSASFLSNQYIKSMNRPSNQAKWKTIGHSERNLQ